MAEDGIKDFARKSLASYKTPEEVVFSHLIPRNPTGKILRRVLRDENTKGGGERAAMTRMENGRKSESAGNGGLLVVWRMVLANARLRALFCWLKTCCSVQS